MLKNFKKTKQVDADMKAVLGSADQITQLFNEVAIRPRNEILPGTG